MKKLIMLFLVLLVIASGCSQVSKRQKIGILQYFDNEEFSDNVRGFKDGLKNNGYIEGENVEFLTRISNGDQEKQRELVNDLITEDVDLIYSLTTVGTIITKNMTTDIPIIFSIVTYPVESGLINSLKESGNNLVGTRNFISVEKQYYAFERIYPNTTSMAFVHRKDEPNSEIQYNDFKKLLDKRNINIIKISAVDLDDMKMQLEENKDDIDSIYSACDTLVQDGGQDIILEFAKENAIPNFSCLKDEIIKGALVGNIADFYSIGEISGEKAAQVLGGMNPSWLMTESPRTDYVIINLNRAEELNLTVSNEILNNAEEIID